MKTSTWIGNGTCNKLVISSLVIFPFLKEHYESQSPRNRHGHCRSVGRCGNYHRETVANVSGAVVKGAVKGTVETAKFTGEVAKAGMGVNLYGTNVDGTIDGKQMVGATVDAAKGTAALTGETAKAGVGVTLYGNNVDGPMGLS